MLRTPALALALALLTLAIAPVYAFGPPQPSTTTVQFDGFTVTVSNNFVVNSTTRTLTGTSSITVVNSTSGATLLSKTFNINLSFGTSNSISLVLAVAPSALNLAVSCKVVVGSPATCTVTHDPDLNHDGTVDISDVATVALSYDSAAGSPNFNSKADLNADGVVNIFDVALVASDYGAAVFQ